MIVASHQPNFMPYMGFFYKMYKCDVFTFSDTVQFSSSGYHNYNYIDLNGARTKLTVPVRKHCESIKDIELCDWSMHREKIKKTIKQAYSKTPYYEEISPLLFNILNQDYKYMYELNIALIEFFTYILGIDRKLILESSLELMYENASQDICDICKQLGATTYYSGNGAKVYIEQDIFDKNGINIEWSDYETIEEDENLKDMSVLDYVMKHGGGIPKQWQKN